MLITLNCSLYLCRDININLLNYDNHSGSMFFVDQLFSVSLFPHIYKCTCIAHDSCSTIDYIFTNVLHDKVHCGILINDMSEYSPLFCITGHKVIRKQEIFS